MFIGKILQKYFYKKSIFFLFFLGIVLFFQFFITFSYAREIEGIGVSDIKISTPSKEDTKSLNEKKTTTQHRQSDQKINPDTTLGQEKIYSKSKDKKDRIPSWEKDSTIDDRKEKKDRLGIQIKERDTKNDIKQPQTGKSESLTIFKHIYAYIDNAVKNTIQTISSRISGVMSSKEEAEDVFITLPLVKYDSNKIQQNNIKRDLQKEQNQKIQIQNKLPPSGSVVADEPVVSFSSNEKDVQIISIDPIQKEDIQLKVSVTVIDSDGNVTVLSTSDGTEDIYITQEQVDAGAVINVEYNCTEKCASALPYGYFAGAGQTNGSYTIQPTKQQTVVGVAAQDRYNNQIADYINVVITGSNDSIPNIVSAEDLERRDTQIVQTAKIISMESSKDRTEDAYTQSRTQENTQKEQSVYIEDNYFFDDDNNLVTPEDITYIPVPQPKQISENNTGSIPDGITVGKAQINTVREDGHILDEIDRVAGIDSNLLIVKSILASEAVDINSNAYKIAQEEYQNLLQLRSDILSVSDKEYQVIPKDYTSIQKDKALNNLGMTQDEYAKNNATYEQIIERATQATQKVLVATGLSIDGKITSVSTKVNDILTDEEIITTGNQLLSQVTTDAGVIDEKKLISLLQDNPSLLVFLQTRNTIMTIEGKEYQVTEYIIGDKALVGSPYLAKNIAQLTGQSIPTVAQAEQIRRQSEGVFIANNIPVGDSARIEELAVVNCIKDCDSLTAGAERKMIVRVDDGVYGIYGGKRENSLTPIQPLYTKHSDTYGDYSQGIVLVSEITDNTQEDDEMYVLTATSINEMTLDEAREYVDEQVAAMDVSVRDAINTQLRESDELLVVSNDSTENKQQPSMFNRTFNAVADVLSNIFGRNQTDTNAISPEEYTVVHAVVSGVETDQIPPLDDSDREAIARMIAGEIGSEVKNRFINGTATKEDYQAVGYILTTVINRAASKNTSIADQIYRDYQYSFWNPSKRTQSIQEYENNKEIYDALATAFTNGEITKEYGFEITANQPQATHYANIPLSSDRTWFNRAVKLAISTDRHTVFNIPGEYIPQPIPQMVVSKITEVTGSVLPTEVTNVFRSVASRLKNDLQVNDTITDPNSAQQLEQLKNNLDAEIAQTKNLLEEAKDTARNASIDSEAMFAYAQALALYNDTIALRYSLNDIDSVDVDTIQNAVQTIERKAQETQIISKLVANRGAVLDGTYISLDIGSGIISDRKINMDLIPDYVYTHPRVGDRSAPERKVILPDGTNLSFIEALQLVTAIYNKNNPNLPQIVKIEGFSETRPSDIGSARHHSTESGGLSAAVDVKMYTQDGQLIHWDGTNQEIVEAFGQEARKLGLNLEYGTYQNKAYMGGTAVHIDIFNQNSTYDTTRNPGGINGYSSGGQVYLSNTASYAPDATIDENGNLVISRLSEDTYAAITSFPAVGTASKIENLINTLLVQELGTDPLQEDVGVETVAQQNTEELYISPNTTSFKVQTITQNSETDLLRNKELWDRKSEVTVRPSGNSNGNAIDVICQTDSECVSQVLAGTDITIFDFNTGLPATTTEEKSVPVFQVQSIDNSQSSVVYIAPLVIAQQQSALEVIDTLRQQNTSSQQPKNILDRSFQTIEIAKNIGTYTIEDIESVTVSTFDEDSSLEYNIVVRRQNNDKGSTSSFDNKIEKATLRIPKIVQENEMYTALKKTGFQGEKEDMYALLHKTQYTTVSVSNFDSKPEKKLLRNILDKIIDFFSRKENKNNIQEIPTTLPVRL